MLIIQQTSTDPYFNIAAEEFLLKNFTGDIFILYRNQPSIVVGKHQNTIAEINLEFVREKGLKVVRRLSGGGTVYHDLGNLNYTFIANGSEGNLVDFKKFTQPIIDVLQKLGVDAMVGGKNDIRVGDKKISGNAEHVFKNRVLHHGTLLFNSNLDELNESIKINPNTYTDKAVKSIRSHVANISEYLKDNLSIDEFAQLILNHIQKIFPNSSQYQFTNNDLNAISELIKTRYSTWDWNYGYSPSYTLNNQITINGKTLKIEITVDQGIITKIALDGELIIKEKIAELETILCGCQHDANEILRKLSTVNFDDFIIRLSKEEFVKKLF